MRILITLLFLAILTVSSNAQDKRPMTPDDVAAIKGVSSAVLADDGRTIAYTLTVQADPKVENKPASSHLYIYDLNSGESMPFLTRSSVSGLAFRPGHNSVTFRGRLDGDKTTGIYEISLKGGEATRIVDHGTSVQGYSWNSDGTEVVFVATEASTEKTSDLPYQPDIYEGDLKYSRAWIASPGGDARMLSVEGNVEGALWSPDGSRILMSVSTSPLVDDHYMRQQLHVYDIARDAVIGSVDHQGKMGEYTWSPDGTRIAFIAGANINDPVAGRLFIAGTGGGKPTQLNAGYGGAYEEIEWLSNERIDYLASKGTASVIGSISPDGEEISEVTLSTLSVTTSDVTTGGAMCMVANSSEFPGELFYTDGVETRRLTVSNPWLEEISMGKQDVITYRAADGLEVEGILIYPVDYDSEKRYPLIVAVHGGPEAHIDNGWLTGYSYPGHVGAGKGYAVFYPNYRGSTGRGLEYTLTSQGEPAGKEFDDIVDGVDYLIETGLVDANKVGVTGGSYGGYATAWLSTRYSDKFAGGVMFVGISDKVSKWGTTDIPNEEYLVHARKWVYEDYDFFLKRSPVYYADQCKTPLLIMHGAEDPRVHPSQSMEMYRHVKSRTDTPVELIFYPGEGHGNRNSTARYDYNLRMLAWFDQYVKGEKS